MATAIAKAKGELATLLSTKADPGAISGLTAKIADLEAKMKTLSQQRKTAETDAKRQAEAEKILADVKLKEAQATKALEQAELARTQAQVAQEKELDRQIALEQKEQRELEKKKKALDALPNSYNAIRNALNQLRPQIQGGNTGALINFGGQKISFDQAIGEFKKLSFAEQDFRRQFQKDGTLVGEYAKGIANAFQRLGIDDIIKNNIDGGKKAIGELEKKTNDLVVAYRKAQQSGSSDMNKLQKEIHDNVVETEALRKKTHEAEVQLRGISGVGGQIANSISKNFKDLKSSIGQFVLTYVGFQAAFRGIQSTVKLNFDFEDTVHELKAITGVAGSDLEFLKLQALETSSKTKFSATEILESFKLIASAKPELLDNVEGLNQVKDAAVTLAQASGQTLPAAVDSLTKVLNQFGAEAGKSAEYIDALAAGAKFGAAEIPNIASALLEFGTQAKSSNISVQESVGLIELLAEKGIQGAEAGTKLRNVLLVLNAADALPKRALDSLKAAGVDIKKLSDNTLPLEERLKELSKAAKDNATLVQIFGKENFNAGQIVLQNVPRYAQLAKQVQETGIAQEQATENTNSASVAWDKLRNQFQNLVTSNKVTAVLTGLASVLSVLLGNIGLILGIFVPLIAAFGIYRAVLAVTAFQQGILNKETFAYFVLSGLRAGQQAILNGLQAAQNFLMAAYIALTIRATLATGASAVAIRALSVAVRFLTGPVGIALTLTTALVTAFGIFSASAKSADSAVKGLAKSKAQLAAEDRVNAQLAERIASATTDQVAKIQTLTKVATDLTVSEQTRKKALDELIKISPKYNEALQSEGINIDKVRQLSDGLIESLKKQAKAKALQQLTAEKEKRKIEIETQISILGPSNAKDEKGFGSFLQNIGSAAGLGKGTKGQQLRQLSNELDEIDNDLKVIYGQVGKNVDLQNAIIDEASGKTTSAAGSPEETDAEALIRLRKLLKDTEEEIKSIDRVKGKTTEQLARLKQLRRDKTEILKQIKEITGKSGTGSGRSSEKQKLDDDLKEIEAGIIERKNVLDSQFAEGLLSEKDYYTQVRDNTIKGEQEKIKIILDYQQRYKKALAKFSGDLAKDVAEAERKQLAAKRDANQKLFDVDNKQLEIDLKNEQSAALRNRDTALLNPNLSNEERFKIQQDYLDRLIVAQVVFNQKQIELEKQYKIKSVDNAQKRKEEIEKLSKELQLSPKEQYEAAIKDIQESGEKERLQIDAKYAIIRKSILDNETLTKRKKDQLIKLLDEAYNRTILSSELKQLQKEFADKEEAFKKDLITEKEYLDAKAKLKKKEAELSGSTKVSDALKTPSSSTTQGVLQGALSDALGLGKDSKESDLLGFAIAESFNIAKDAMSSFFDAQAQRIENEKQDHLDALDREKERVKSRATSKAEEDAIDRLYAEKKRAVEKEAGEQLKKQKKSEAKISLAAELANIAVAAAANPLNGVTLGAAGAIMYGVLAALALGRYVLRVNEINKTQFAYGGTLKKKQYGLGGKTGEVPVNGGVFGGNPHSRGGTDFSFNGQDYNAEVEEMNIIRTKNAPRNRAYTITGNHTQIASALNSIGGGKSFSPGASVSKLAMGGALGSRLKAPSFSASYYLNGGNVGGGVNNNNDRIERLESLTEQVLAAVYATDVKEVQLNPGKVTKAQKKTTKDISVGTI